MPLPLKGEVPIETLASLDLRVGEIVRVEDIAGSDRLVSLRVDFGDHQRTIVVGMKRERENCREVEGLQALFVLNLPQKRLYGVWSEGMLLDVGYPDGLAPALLTPERRMPNGASAG